MATLLVIDDSEALRNEIRGALSGTGLFTRMLEASNGLQGLKLLMGEPIDLVLCDLEMPGLEGDKLMRIRESGTRGANIPFVFLTGNASVARKAQLLHDGASDAISKPFHPADLVARLGLHLKVKRLQDELMVKNATLARLSTVDGLTGLRTRRYIDDYLNIEVLRAQRYRTPLAVVMADLDHFKQINDRFGHPAGDAVLRSVSARLLSMVRATDTAGRYGGEEFLVIQSQNGARGAAIMSERLRILIEEEPIEIPAGPPIRVTLSIGIAEYGPDADNPELLLAAADRALYAAKQEGRNRIVIAGEQG